MLTLVVFDFSGTSFSPVSKGNHDHEHPLSKLREIGAHAGNPAGVLLSLAYVLSSSIVIPLTIFSSLLQCL
jgi:hypothetical protein